MPKSFLVKSRSSTRQGSRNWGALSDQLRGDTYIPEGRLAKPFPGPWVLRANSLGMWERTPEGDPGSLIPSLFPSPMDLVGKYPRSNKGRGPPARAEFVCHVCSKSFPLQRMMNRHLKCHSSVKKHICKYCGKGFNDTFDLKRHLRTHTGIRPYCCRVCNKAFTQRCSLESHLKKIHSIQQHYAYRERRSKLFVCEECGFTCSGSDEYYGHMRQLHPAHGLVAEAFQEPGAPPSTSQGHPLPPALHTPFHVLYPSAHCG
ncbi:putative transcription factor ovo-like protein 3 [Hemicordylus capensis]|uniref:putative transcription factor ovo-like protein 3 n=1 Tax=Hemicordylus capensis TaxID=884348 RepID=UPI002302D3E1|nr:putative transcription factor ovo-like protein 3 [Hemicordylus capensis]